MKYLHKVLLSLTLVSLSLLLGCAVGPQYETIWINAKYSNSEFNQYLTIDHGYCFSEAINKIDIPQVQLQSNQYGSTGMLAGYMAGQRAAQQDAMVNSAFQAREALYNACMAQKGWSVTQRLIAN